MHSYVRIVAALLGLVLLGYGAYGYTYTFGSCPQFSKTASFVEMIGTGGRWPSAGFCRTMISKSIAGSSYSLSVSLYNVRSSTGHPGILYNAKDINNFDFVYFRPHWPRGCFQTGYVKNGLVVLAGGLSSSCSNGPPTHQKWFNAKVEVRGQSVTIMKDGQVVSRITSHLTPTGKGGVLVANGYKNTIRFKDYLLSKIISPAG